MVIGKRLSPPVLRPFVGFCFWEGTIFLPKLSSPKDCAIDRKQ